MIETARQLAISPELDRRLKEQFPPGTQARALADTLREQGFKSAGVCDTDPTIFIGALHRSELSASVYWKVNANGSIVWTVGIVTHFD